MKVRWMPLALGDLSRVHEYVARENRKAALAIIERIANSVAMLALHPHLGRAGRIKGTRELVIAGTPFIIAYREKSDRIELLSIIHSARRWPDAL